MKREWIEALNWINDKLSGFSQKYLPFDNLVLILLFITFVFGSLVLIIPIEYLILSLIGICVVAVSLYKPEIAFYLFVFFVPFVMPNYNYLHFQDVCIALCVLSLLVNLIFFRYKVVNIYTKHDIWIILLLFLFCLKGFGSIEFSRGSLHSIRFIEAVIVYYMTVYFIRTNKIKISTIIKILIVTSLLQAGLGVLQSLTNSFGVQDYANERGYFGYLGIGPKIVYSGRGTFWHFASFGYYLGTIMLFLLPFYRNIFKRKLLSKAILFILFAGLIFSYSRGALGMLFVGLLYFLFLIEKDKKAFLFKTLLIGLLITPFVVLFGSNPEYIQSLNPRNNLWKFHIQYLSEHMDEFFWGAGFESRELTFYQFAPKYLRHPGDINPHNLIIYYIEETGIFGFIYIILFWLKVFINSLFTNSAKSKLTRTLFLSTHLVVFYVFMSGINDHVYHDPYMTMFLFLLIGMFYAKYKISSAPSA